MLKLNLGYDQQQPVKDVLCLDEFEGTLNSIGQRQNDLIKQMTLSMEWFAFNRSEEGSRSKLPQVQIPEFSPSTTGYKYEPMNLYSSQRHERRRK